MNKDLVEHDSIDDFNDNNARTRKSKDCGHLSLVDRVEEFSILLEK